jgi:cytochrome c-type biogenesis protein CcmE
MRPARKRRLMLVSLMVIGVGIATAFALTAFNRNLMFFFTPTEVVAGEAPSERLFRIGGMVVDGSVERPGEGLTVRFRLTDFDQVVMVEYTGILPDLFREGQGIVANGKLRGDGVFVAQEVLAKHDENYMPPEVAKMMEGKIPPKKGGPDDS